LRIKEIIFWGETINKFNEGGVRSIDSRLQGDRVNGVESD